MRFWVWRGGIGNSIVLKSFNTILGIATPETYPFASPFILGVLNKYSKNLPLITSLLGLNIAIDDRIATFSSPLNSKQCLR